MNDEDIFALPRVPQEAFVKALGLFTVIHKSFTSEKFRELLQFQKYTVKRMMVRQRLSDWGDVFLIEIHTEEKALVTLVIWQNCSKEVNDILWNVGGENVWVKPSGDKLFYVKFKEDSEERFRMLVQVTQSLLEWMHPMKLILDINQKDSMLTSLPIYNGVHNFEQFSVVSTKATNISPETLRRLLEEVSSKLLHLMAKVEDLNFKFEGTTRVNSNIDKIEIFCSNWIDYCKPSFGLNAPTIRVNVPDSKVANRILKDWINGVHDSIKNLKLQNEAKFITASLLEKIPFKTTVFTQQQLFERTEMNWNCCGDPKVVDLKRIHDKRKATLQFRNAHLTLTVWSEEESRMAPNIATLYI